MALLESLPASFGAQPRDFRLMEVGGKYVTLRDAAGERGLFMVFMCNHCPYVLAKIDRIVYEMKELKKIGINSVAIMPNDVAAYPADSFENMKQFKEEHGIPCPYVIDDTQEVAKAYGAQCTPDFYLFICEPGGMKLKYRGRLDSGGKSNNENDVRDLYQAAVEALHGVDSHAKQHPSIGCSIKWI